MAKKNEVAKVENEKNGMLATTDQMPAWLDPSSNRGSEDVTVDDLTLPRLDVLQAISPQVKKSDPKYIEGAEQGTIFNTLSGELYGSSITIVPVVFRREFILWQDRKSGGGFRGAFPTEEQAERERQMQENPEAHEVVETHVHFVLLLREDGRIEEAVLSMSKSKRKASRKLNSLVQMVPGDRFARAYQITAVEVDGPKGEYWSFDVNSLGYVNEEVWKRGRESYEAIHRGERAVDRTAEEAADEPHGSAKV